MAVYFLDNDQQLIKIVPDNGAISILQTQELPEDGSLLKDVLSVHLKNDERLFDAQYMAIKSYDGNRNSFDMYRIVNELVPDNATEFEGVQVAPYELEGVVVEDLRPQGWTIERTTNQILKDSDWRLGYVDDNLPTVSTNFYYLSVKDSLKKLQELTGVEFTFKVEISGNKITDKWVEVYRELGNRTLKRFNYGTNALTVKRETSHSELYTALIGRGKGEEVGETDAGDATYGRKINFADVEWKKSEGKPVDKPKGQKYIELPQATAEFGIKMLDGRKVPRIGLVEFPDTEEPEELINQTWQVLQEYARPKVLFSTTVANIGDTGIGDTVTIHRHDLKMHYKTRVRKVMRNRKNNDKTQVEIGDVVYTASTKRQSNINSQLNNMQNDLSNVRDEVSHVVVSADGKNTINYGNAEPERKKVGDSWVRDHPSLTGETQWLVWNGEAWELILDTSETTLNKEAIEQAQQEIAEAQQTADEAVEQIDTAVANAGFTSLDETISSVQSISNQAQTNASTAIDNALEAMQQASQAVDNTGSLNIRVDEVENTLSVKADKQTVDDLTGIVDLQALDIKANADGLALKANQDTVDTLAGTVSSLGTEFDVIAGQVNSRVWNTDIETAIDGIEIGGRNLALGTSDKWVEIDNVGNNYGHLISVAPIQEDGHYTVSVDFESLENDDTTSLRLWEYIGSDDGTYVQSEIEDGTLSVTKYFNKGSNARIQFRKRPEGSNHFRVRKIQLEKGNKATDWTPAPEDTLARFDHIETEWTQTFDTFSQTVAGIDGRVTSQKQTIDSITQTVTDQTGKIATVEQNVHGIQQTVSDPVNGLVTQVSTLANGFNVLAKDFEDMEVGGRNYALGTSNEFKDVSVGDYSGSLSDAKVTSKYEYSLKELNLEAGNKITVRLFVGESEEGFGGHIRVDDDSGKNIFSGVTSPVVNDYAIATVTVPENISGLRFYLARDGSNSNYMVPVKEFKIEKGTKATDWTPAPEDMATQAQLSVLNDNINLRVEKDKIISQINLSPENILLQANKIQALGDVVVDGKLTITDEFIAPNAQIDGAKIADATIGSAKIVNLDVNKLSGNSTEFVQSAWNNAVGGNVSISGSGIVTTASNGAQGLIQNGVFLARRPEGSTVGYIGYDQSNGPSFQVTTSLGAHFKVRNHLGNEVYKDLFTLETGGTTARFNVDQVIFDGTGGRFQAYEFNNRWGGGMYATTSYITRIYSGQNLEFMTNGRNHEDRKMMLDNTRIYMYNPLNMGGRAILDSPSVSDERMKDVRGLRKVNDLQKLMQIKFVDFKWKSPEFGGEDLGFIAQQVQQVAPEIITTAHDGMLGYNSNTYMNLIGHAVQQLALKEENTNKIASQALQATETNAQKINRLEKRIEELESVA